MPTHSEEFRRVELVKAIKQLNPYYKRASKSSWPKEKPDLENPITRQVVRVELRNFYNAWKDCLSYQAAGAAKVHLVLSPSAFEDYEREEELLKKEGTWKTVDVYLLPKIIRKSNFTLKPKSRKPKAEPTAVEPYDPLSIPVDFKDGTVKMPRGTKVILDKEFKLAQIIEIKRDGKFCIECEHFVNEGKFGSCKEYGWLIDIDLAKRDALCVV